jgi:hypothetical protein
MPQPVPARTRSSPRGGHPEPGPPASGPAPAECAAFRAHLHAARGAGINAPDADAWGRGAYLELVLKVRTLLNAPGLSLASLQALSRVLSEQRRAETQARESDRRRSADRAAMAPASHRAAGRADPSVAGEPPPTGALPPHFGPLVQRIYGVELSAPGSATDLGDVRAEAARPRCTGSTESP